MIMEFNRLIFFLPEYRACSISANLQTCLAVNVLTKVIEKAACDEFTTNRHTRRNCHCGFKLADSTAKVACGVSLNYLCDAEYCPQNVYNPSCQGRQAYDGSNVENFDCDP